MNQPFFSIITCTHNSATYLRECLQSVREQTYQNYEHICIDGMSTDGTMLDLERYKRRQGTKVKIYRQKPQGISAAMNFGIQKSRGRYIYILHSDDAFLDKNVLRDVATYIEQHTDLDWLYGSIQVRDAVGTVIGVFPKYSIFKQAWYWLLKYINFVPHQAVFMKRRVFEENGLFLSELKTVMDYEYWLRIGEKTKWRYMSRIVAKYRIHSAAQSSSKTNFRNNIAELGSIQSQYCNSYFDTITRTLINNLIFYQAKRKVIYE